MKATNIIRVDPQHIDKVAIARAIEVLERGGLVAFPTETVYGIAANLLSKTAQQRLRSLKDRPDDKQFTIHVADKEDVHKYAVAIIPRAYKMIERFWPGPLTLVFNAPDAKNVGLRMPSNSVALRLLSGVDFPVVAPSANLAGNPAPTEASSVLKELDGHIELILDGGPTEFGVSSTVLDVMELPFKVLRKGYISEEVILKAANETRVLFVCTGNSCRSVMAEYLLKKKMMASGRDDVEVISAGTFAFPGMPPSPETQDLILKQLGLNSSEHRAQKINLGLLRSSDYIFVMERHHARIISKQFPQVEKNVKILGDFVNFNPLEAEIDDPIGRSKEFYEQCFNKIKDAVKRLEI